MSRRIVYCHCAHERVLDEEKKTQVLAALAASGLEFDAVPDLCAASARKDPQLARWAGEEVVIAACFPRAVRWLFHAAGTPISEERASILNLREHTAEHVVAGLLEGSS